MRVNVYCIVLLLLVGGMESCAQGESQKLLLPKDSEDLEQANASNPKYRLTLILDEQDKIVYYSGAFKKGMAGEKTDYKNVREIIINKKKEIGDSIVVIIKPGAGATYKNTVDILDEMSINDIKRYVLVDITREEETAFGTKAHKSESSTNH